MLLFDFPKQTEDERRDETVAEDVVARRSMYYLFYYDAVQPVLVCLRKCVCVCASFSVKKRAKTRFGFSHFLSLSETHIIRSFKKRER